MIDITSEMERFCFTKKGRIPVYTRSIDDSMHKLWIAASPDHSELVVSFGAISPKVNKMAFRRLKDSTGIRPTFSPEIGPPIVIAKTFRFSSKSKHGIHEFTQSFVDEYLHYSTGQWFMLARKMIPYQQSSMIIIPCYFDCHEMKAELGEYIELLRDFGVDANLRPYIDSFGISRFV